MKYTLDLKTEKNKAGFGEQCSSYKDERYTRRLKLSWMGILMFEEENNQNLYSC